MRFMNGTARAVVVFRIVPIVVFVAVAVAQTQAPFASISAINTQTGVVTGKVNSTGQQFQFTLNNPAQLSQLRVGQGVYVNLTTKQVSLDGKAVFGSITMLGSRTAEATGISATGNSAACCQVTGVLQGQNLAHAKVTSSGQVFDFALNDPSQTPQLHSGQAVYANFTSKQVSLDGQHSAGYITSYSGWNQQSSASAATAAPAPTPNSAVRSTSNGSTTQHNPQTPTTGITNNVRVSALAVPDFAISFAPNSPTTAPENTVVTYTLNITRVGNLNGTINLSGKINGLQSVAVNPSTVTLGCSTSAPAHAQAGTLQAARVSCNNPVTAQLSLTKPTVIPGDALASATQNIEVLATYSHDTVTISHSAHITLTLPPSAPPVPTVPPAAIQAAADLLTGSGQVALASQCASDPRFNCDANNQPVSTTLQVTRNNMTFGQVTVPGSSSPLANTYTFTASLALKAQSAVPASFEGQSCNIAIDTAGGASTQVSGTLNVASTSVANVYKINLSGWLNMSGALPVTIAAASGPYSATVCSVSAGTVSWPNITRQYITQALTSRLPSPACIRVSLSGTTAQAQCP